jgi:hypothetical protein
MWTNPLPVIFPNANAFDKAIFFSQYVSDDGKILLLSIQGGPDSHGGFDLYMSQLQANGKWSTPVNLGPVINTKGDELFPSLDAEGNLYFSSTGHPGLGGTDIYRANGILNHWHSVENLGVPINSASDDYAIMFYPNSSSSGLFTSNRPGGVGGDDIYSFDKIHGNLNKKYGIVAVKVVDANDVPISDVTVSFVTSKKITHTATTPISGEVFFAAPLRQNYAVSVSSKNNLYARITDIKGEGFVKADSTFNMTIKMKKLRARKPPKAVPKKTEN